MCSTLSFHPPNLGEHLSLVLTFQSGSTGGTIVLGGFWLVGLGLGLLVNLPVCNCFLLISLFSIEMNTV